jgi:hypothetical protein
MLERTFWDAGVEVDRLADELVRWFRRRGFETQDFAEEPEAIVIQARKASWLRTVSGLNLALTVRLTPHREDLQVEIGASEWVDKAIGGALAMLVAWPFAITTGIGLFQQSQLPQEVLDYIETYIEARRRRRRPGEPATSSARDRREPLKPRRPGEEELPEHRRQGFQEDHWIEREMAELEAFDKRLQAARGEASPPGPMAEPEEPAGTAAREIELSDLDWEEPSPRSDLSCPECDAPIEPGDRFCPECGVRLG